MSVVLDAALSEPQVATLPPATLPPAELRRTLLGVMACFLVHGLVISTWVARIAGVKAALHLSDGTLGLALLGTAIGSVTAIPVCGGLVSWYGSRRVAMFTSVGFCVALALPPLARNVWGLFAALLFFGAMAGANDVAMNSQAVGTEKLLGRPTMSRFHALFSFGGILGACAGGFVAGHGVPPLPHMLVAALLFLIFALVMSRRMIDPPSQSAEHATRLSLRKIPAALLALCAIGFCIFLSEGAVADWTAVYLKQVLHAGEGLAPVGYAVFSTTMAIFRFVGDGITLRLGRAWTIRGGAMLAAAGLALAISVPSPYWALLGFAATGAGFSSIIPLVFAAGGRIPGVGEGAGVATVSGLGYIGFLVGPPAIGFVSEMLSLRAGLFLLVLLSGIAAALVSVVEKRDSRVLAK